MNEEIFPIVDENDNLIGAKPRKDVLESDIFRVAGLVLVNKKGEILLAKRAATKKLDPNEWGHAAAGHVQAGETYEESIRRETEEELGIKLPCLAPLSKSFHENINPITGKLRRRFSQSFIALAELPISAFRPDPTEVSEVRWISLQNLEKELKLSPANFVPSMSDILVDIKSFLSNHPDFLKGNKKEKP